MTKKYVKKRLKIKRGTNWTRHYGYKHCLDKKEKGST